MPPLPGRGRNADPAGEQRTEATDARKSHDHANLRDRLIRENEEFLRALDPGVGAVLVGRGAEDRLEEADEVVGRKSRSPRNRLHGRQRLGLLAQPFPGQTEPAQ